jgi:uncharacterized protein
MPATSSSPTKASFSSSRTSAAATIPKAVREMERAPRDRSKPNSIDEATDAYDTVDWLIKNVPNHNGRAGMLGISYGGWLTAMALMEPHPALKAVSEQASPADMFLGDDFHHNGAFRLSYGFEYVSRMETGKIQFKFDFDKYDTFDWYLQQGPLSELDGEYFHGEKPTWNNFVNHPNYDSFWKAQVVNLILKKTTVPNLNVAGWWDQEDYYGPMKIYETLEKQDAEDHKNYLVVGPWRHGGWGGAGAKLGPIEFGADQSLYFRENIEAPWFAYWLKDKGQLHQPEAMAFETGRNSWERYAAWPPREGIQDRHLNFAAGSKLSFDASRDDTAFDAYVSDPAHPVPYRHRPIRSHLLGRLGMAGVAGPGSALRLSAPGRARLRDRASVQRSGDRRRRRRAPLRFHLRLRFRLDRQADRRLSRERRKASRLSAHDRRRSFPRPLPQQFRKARARRTQPRL